MLGARPTHGASFYIRFGLGGRSSSTAGPSKYAERVLNLVVEPTVDSEPNRWVELAGRQQKRATWLDAPNRTPRLGLIPDRVRVIRPSGGRLPWFLGVGRRPTTFIPPRVQAVTRRPRRTAGRCLQRLLGCAGGLHARVVPPYDGPTQALRPHRGGSERPVR